MGLDAPLKSLLPIVFVAMCLGCGGAGLVPVEGMVTLDGKPLVGAKVTMLRNEGPSEERTFLAETDTEGKFQLTTADGNSHGTPPGSYHLFITSVKPPPDMNEMTKLPPERVPQKWRNGSVHFEVPAGGTTEANFAIKTK